MNNLKLIGKIIFLAFTIYLTIPYFIALKIKFEEPHFKNLNTKEFILFGIILTIFFFINYKFLSPYFRKSKI